MILSIIFKILLFLQVLIVTDASQKSNIVLILADDLGYGEFEGFSIAPEGRKISTPNLMKLASESMLFTDAYAGAPVCGPSRTTLFTGLHTGHVPIRGNGPPALSKDDLTLMEVLKNDYGYYNAMIGKWGLGDNSTTGAPSKKGWDYYFGQTNQADCHCMYPSFFLENTNCFDLIGNEETQQFQPSRETCMAEDTGCNYTHSLYTEKALEVIEERSKLADEPFFLALTYTIPHAGGWLMDNKQTGAPVPNDGIYSDKDWPIVEKDHAAQITEYLDKDIGRVVALLKKLDIDLNTMVIFATDNGPHNEGNHDVNFFNSSGVLRGFKRSLYEGGMRSPTMFRFPGKIKPGTISHFPSAFYDFFPTILDVVSMGSERLNETYSFDGESILPTLLGEQNRDRENPLYWEFCANDEFGQAIRLQNWKGVRFSYNGSLELYDLKSDIGENKNLASLYPDIVNNMEQKLIENHKDSKYWPIENCKTG